MSALTPTPSYFNTLLSRKGTFAPTCVTGAVATPASFTSARPIFTAEEVEALIQKVAQDYYRFKAEAQIAVEEAQKNTQTELAANERRLREEETHLLRAKAVLTPMLKEIEHHGKSKVLALEASNRRAENTISTLQARNSFLEAAIDPLALFPSLKYAKAYWSAHRKEDDALLIRLEQLMCDFETKECSISQTELGALLKKFHGTVQSKNEHMDSIQAWIVDKELELEASHAR